MASLYDVFIGPLSNGFQCFSSASTVAALGGCAAADAFRATFLMMLLMSAFTFAASRVTRNDSWVDRLWSIVPVVYAWVLAVYGRPVVVWHSTSVVFAALITMWGARLTFNFHRKGGYRCGGEDYRWAHVRTWTVFQSRWVWTLFSLGFVSFFQSLVLWMITVPVYYMDSSVPCTTTGAVIAALFVVALAFESLCDQQQWDFQNEKRRVRGRVPSVDYDIGFRIDGTFGFSRHLNVFCEQCIWTTVFFAAAVQQRNLFHGTFLGAFLLVLITVSSTRLTEQLSLSKYPLYRVYQRTTPMLLPSLRYAAEFTKAHIRLAKGKRAK